MLSLAGSDIGAGVRTAALVAWAEAPRSLGHAWVRPIAFVLTLAAVVTVAIWIATGNSTPFVAVVAVAIAFSVPIRERVLSSLHGADGAGRDLDVLAVVLARPGREQFRAE